VLHIAWSAGEQYAGEARLEAGAAFVLARRMNLPERQPLVAESIDGSAYVFVRLPYVSDPALVITATAGQPVVHRGQRANGAVVQLTGPTGESTTPAPGQKISLTHSGTRIELRLARVLLAGRPGDVQHRSSFVECVPPRLDLSGARP